ncbi:MAG: AAA family ATPase [Planctomycetes bacterium]|nr:AAA family ATPase [Planctomycetota bacterium]
MAARTKLPNKPSNGKGPRSSRKPHGMLTAIAISGFRGFRSLRVDGLAPVNIVTGKNGCGKTTLLEATLAVHSRQNPAWIVNLQAHRGFAAIQKSLGPNYLGLFQDFDDCGIAEIRGEFAGEGSWRVVLERRKAGEIAVSAQVRSSTRADLPPSALTCREFRNNRSVPNHEATVESLPEPPFVVVRNAVPPRRPAILLHPSGRPAGDEEENRFGESKLRGRAQRIVEALRVLDDRIDNVELIRTATGTSFLAESGEYRAPLGLLGGGINNLFRFLVAIDGAPGGLVAIDEVENGIHHSRLLGVFKALISAASEYGTQLVLSTHSAEALEAIGLAAGEAPEILAVVRLDRGEDGSVEADVLQGADAVNSVRLGYELR